MIPGQIYDLQLSADQRQLDLESPLLFPCSCYDVDIGKNIGSEVPWHWHEELEAVCVVQGRGIFRAGEEHWLLGPGEGLLISANTLHRMQLPPGGSCRIHSLVFSAGLLAGGAGSVFEQRYIRPVLAAARPLPFCRGAGDRQAAAEAIEGAYQAFAAEEFGWELLVRAQLSRLWVLAARRLARAGAAAENTDARRLKMMLEYLHEAYDRPVSLAQVAAAAHVGKRECLRCFQRTIGVTPVQYLRQYRIRQACRLLAETDRPVTEIALQCGFEGLSYFSESFRRITGQTPRGYRKALLARAAEQAAGQGMPAEEG